ncbi:MAG: SUMF1/EgtB/PvdO family nonheme iron enzyme [Treponema sp.]|nr:SUMF1/EgtB/PvdO family nonheme iron enzyme [Treponema sp.]
MKKRFFAKALFTGWLASTVLFFLLLGCSSPTGGGLNPPAVVTGLSVTAGDEELEISWAAAGAASAYEVYAAAEVTPGEAPLPGSPAVTVTALSAVVEAVNDKTYHVWVRAVNAAGSGGFSSPAGGMPVGQYYTITYDANGGSGAAPTGQTKFSSDSITIPAHTLTAPSGCVFLGWNTQDNGGGWGYMPGEEYKRKGDVTFYARWVPYTETAAVSGETVNGSASYAFEVTVPNNPVYTNPGSKSVRRGVFVAGRDLAIDSFDMAKYETTQDLWITVQNWALEHGYYFQNLKNAPAGNARNYPAAGINWRDAIVWCNAYSEMTGKEPVYRYGGNVLEDSRNTNAAACNGAEMDKTKNGYRLPTEAEREFAARGGDPDAAAWMYRYAGNDDADAVAWHHGNSPYTVKTVGGKAANSLDIYDLSGNVQEWCWDWMNYAADVPAGTPVDGPAYSAVLSQKPFNGGGVGSNITYSCVTYRWGHTPDYADNYIGFRVVKP